MTGTAINREIFGEVFRLYNRSILPHVRGIRGATRVAIELRNMALKEKGIENCQAEISGKTLKLADNSHFISLVDENMFVEKFLDEVVEDSIVADLGACKGFYSCLSALVSNQNIYSFEFAPENLKALKKNKELNEFDNTNIIEKAASNTNGSVNADFGNHGTNCIGKGNNEVKTVCLDQFFRDKDNPDIIKIDVEGAELHALKGMERILDSKPEIFLELHYGRRKNNFEHDPEEVLDFLKKRHYFYERISERDGSEMLFATTNTSKLSKTR